MYLFADIVLCWFMKELMCACLKICCACCSKCVNSVHFNNSTMLTRFYDQIGQEMHQACVNKESMQNFFC